MASFNELLQRATDIVSGRRKNDAERYRGVVNRLVDGDQSLTPTAVADLVDDLQIEPTDLVGDVLSEMDRRELAAVAEQVPELKAAREGASMAKHNLVQTHLSERQGLFERHRAENVKAMGELDEADAALNRALLAEKMLTDIYGPQPGVA